MLSGGLDSAAAAALTGCTKGIIVTLGEDAPDLAYARLAARALRMDLTHVIVSREQALDALPEVISVLKSFDPAIPNDLPVYFGLKQAKAMGFGSILTGDGSDEIFGGYSYMRYIDGLDAYIRYLSGVMSFNANLLGEHFGIGIMQPFLHRDIVNCALSIGREWKVREMGGTVHGKWVLREALKAVLPDEILWQDKRPLETGSGMAELNSYFDGSIPDEAFYRRIRQRRIYFMNKAHSYYYEIYRRVVGEIPQPGDDQKSCPGCGAGIKKHRGHCKVCGWVERGLL